MCGFVGFIGSGSELDLKRMLRAVEHRGPDDQGIFYKQGVGMAHARLSILDTSINGRQPMFSSNGRYAIVFNGEIYNYLEIKKDLLRCGVEWFGSNTDTEVILKAYELFGISAFARFNGMFSLAIHDFHEGKTILARDRIGKKPLYWSVKNNTLIFGSELKSLLAHPLINKELDFDALAKYLVMDCVPAPQSIIKNVSKLNPGSYAIFSEKIFAEKQYWLPNYSKVAISEDEAADRVEKLLLDSVYLRHRSDVPFGVFLSGGLDSSIIARFSSVIARDPIKTFSLRFPDKNYDESCYARKVAKLIGSDHFEIEFPKENLAELIWNILSKIDEPLADYSLIPTYVVAKGARQEVKVVLGGDGGDELFAGYPTLLLENYSRWLRLLRPAAKLLAQIVPKSDDYMNISFKLNQFVRGASQKNPELRQLFWLSSFLPSKTWEPAEGKFSEPYDAALNFYLRYYLGGCVMTKVDRATMMVGVEARSPLLDYRLVDLCNSLPRSFKVRGLTTKYLLKKIAARHLPPEIVWRKKHGFAMPLARLLKTDLRSLKEDLFNDLELNRLGLVDLASTASNYKQVWNLMVLLIWIKSIMK